MAPYRDLGCYKYKPSRAVSRNLYRKNVIEECYKRAKGLGNKFFAVRSARYCYTSADAGQTLTKYGKTTGCENRKRGMMNLYEISKSDFLTNKLLRQSKSICEE